MPYFINLDNLAFLGLDGMGLECSISHGGALYKVTSASHENHETADVPVSAFLDSFGSIWIRAWMIHVDQPGKPAGYYYPDSFSYHLYLCMLKLMLVYWISHEHEHAQHENGSPNPEFLRRSFAILAFYNRECVHQAPQVDLHRYSNLQAKKTKVLSASFCPTFLGPRNPNFPKQKGC